MLKYEHPWYVWIARRLWLFFTDIHDRLLFRAYLRWLELNAGKKQLLEESDMFHLVSYIKRGQHARYGEAYRKRFVKAAGDLHIRIH